MESDNVVYMDDYKTGPHKEQLTWLQLFFASMGSQEIRAINTYCITVTTDDGLVILAPVACIEREPGSGETQLLYYEYSADTDLWHLTAMDVYADDEDLDPMAYFAGEVLQSYAKKGAATIEAVTVTDW